MLECFVFESYFYTKIQFKVKEEVARYTILKNFLKKYYTSTRILNSQNDKKQSNKIEESNCKNHTNYVILR